MSSARRRVALASVVSAATLISLAPSPASAHGSVFGPVSRVSACFAEGPETPKSQVCKDLVADSGTQPLYDWNEVNIANADGRHQEIIPDGKLCSANREKYRALDWARTDWPATTTGSSAPPTARSTAPWTGPAPTGPPPTWPRAPTTSTCASPLPTWAR